MNGKIKVDKQEKSDKLVSIKLQKILPQQMGQAKPQNEKLMRIDNNGQMQKAYKQIHLLDKQKYNSSNINSNSMHIINSAP